MDGIKLIGISMDLIIDFAHYSLKMIVVKLESKLQDVYVIG